MIVGGKDMEQEFGARLLFAMETNPPAVETNIVQLPFGAALDLSEVDGLVGFSMREWEFAFDLRGGTAQINKLVNFLHGQRHEFQVPDDPRSYTGRFVVEERTRIIREKLDRVTVMVLADTWAKLPPIAFSVNAAGGVGITIESAKMAVQPEITVERPAIAVCGGVQAVLEPGTWKNDSVWLHEGKNSLYVNTLTGGGDQLLEDIWDTPLADIWDKRLAELYWTEAPSTPKTLGEIWDVPLSDIWDKRIIEISNPIDTDNPEYNVTIYAEQGEL